MKKSHFPVIIEQDINGVFIVECPTFKGCRTYGNNLSEALENIREVITLCMEELFCPQPPKGGFQLDI